jgi:hypothetical protein
MACRDQSYAIPCSGYRATELDRKDLDPILDPNSKIPSVTDHHWGCLDFSKVAEK